MECGFSGRKILRVKVPYVVYVVNFVHIVLCYRLCRAVANGFDADYN